MKSSRQQKRKLSEDPQQHNKCTGTAGKKLVNRAAGQCQKAAPEEGKDTSCAPQLSARKLPKRGISFTETTKILEADQQTGPNNHSAKIKLQLFPLNECMRLGLEKDGCNPFLELTLSVRKKISSVIKHLDSKWGSSRVANGELMLFPFNTQLENLASYGQWTRNNSNITAGEVHLAIGSPAVFRLRYGWLSSLQLESFGVPHLSSPFGACIESESNRKGCMVFSQSRYGQLDKLKVEPEELTKSININEAADAAVDDQLPSDAAADHMGDNAKTGDVSVQKLVSWDDLTNLSIGGLLSESSMQSKTSIPNRISEINSGLQTSQLMSEISRGGMLSEASLQSKIKDSDRCTQEYAGDTGLQLIQLESEISIGGLLSEASLQGKNRNCDFSSNSKKLGLQTNMEKSAPQSHFSWDDNLTTLSIGGLLSEASLQGKIKSSDPKLSGSKFSSHEALSISDSFDAFIVAQLNSNPLVSKPLLHDSHSSILDAEETCHAFAFGKFSSSNKNPLTSSGGSSSGGCKNYSSTKPFKFPRTIENGESSSPAQDPFEQPKEIPLSCPKGVYDEDSSLGLSGIKWNDTPGPFDLGLPTSRPVLNGGDSISISEFVR